MNLTDAYASSVLAATRHFSLAADYTQLVITDTIVPRSTDTAVTLTWTMHTYANITVDASGRAATLEQDGRKLRAAVSASTGEGRFQAIDLNITSIPSNQSTVFDKSPGALVSSVSGVIYQLACTGLAICCLTSLSLLLTCPCRLPGLRKLIFDTAEIGTVEVTLQLIPQL